MSFVLGIALGGAALGGWIAAGGSLASFAAWILFIAITSWVAGFDIIYACLDFDFDRQEKLFSFPRRFGLRAALYVSAVLHIVTILSLIYLGYLCGLKQYYRCGIMLASIALFWEHTLVSPKDLSKANAAFFNVNGLVSILVFVSILLDKIFAK